MPFVSYFEIPVTDMPRAIKFYEAVFGHHLTPDNIDGIEMALFPLKNCSDDQSADRMSDNDDNDIVAGNITGALAKGDSYQPGRQGARIYFSVYDIDQTLKKAETYGGSVFYPKTDVGEHGFVAEFIDSEGNIIALHQSA